MIYFNSDSEQFSTNFSNSNTIGFDSKELMEMCSEELLNLRVSVINYLNCRKLKHRNSEFMNLFHRINHELKERKITIQSVKINKKPNENTPKSKFLGRKFTFSDTLFEIHFPNFLNDKENRKQNNYEEEITNLENCLRQKKKSLATNCIYLLTIVFNKGLFNEKFDFELNEEDLSHYQQFKPRKFENEKEKKLNDTMFSIISEDSFFNLN